MSTHVVAAESPTAIDDAAAILRAGGLVAFPTETVYGLGANALDAAAVARIFAAKGRPATNPIIVHVLNVPQALPLVREFSEKARRLTDHFWPGPLTLVLPKSDLVPDNVTAGGPTVALRAPAHPVARALLQACRLPLAAPSANPATMLSPTTAEHVLRGLDGRIDLILDGGPSTGGLESTVLDMSVSPPRLLRPGLISLAAIAAVIGPVDAAANAPTDQPLRSPGQQARHYAPRTPLECVVDGTGRVLELLGAGRRVGWLRWRRDHVVPPGAVMRLLPDDAIGYAAELYAVLHELDGAGLDVIVVDAPPQGDDWLAVRDRLRRAAR